MATYDPRFLRLKTYDTQPGNLWVYDAKSADNTIEEVLSAGFFNGAFYQMKDGDVMIIIDVTEILFSPIRKTDNDIELDESINLNYTASDIDYNDDIELPETGCTNVQQILDWFKDKAAILGGDASFESLLVDQVPSADKDVVTLDYLNSALANRFLNLPNVETIATSNVNIASNLIGQVINGYTIVDQDLILLIAQTDAKQNLVYVVNASGLVAVPSCDVGKDLQSGLVSVNDTASTFANNTYQTFGTPLIVGTDEIQWELSNFGYNATGAIEQVNNVFKLSVETPVANEWIDGVDSSGNYTKSPIADGSITTAKIADSNVTTAKIADSNVTTAKVADGSITNSKLVDNSIAYSRLANISSNNILGRSGSGGSVVAMSISTVKSMLGYPTSSVVNNIVTFSTTGGGMQDSGISKNIVATIDTDVTPQAGQFSVFETTGFNTLVTSGFGLSSIGNKFMVLSLTITQSAGISDGNPVIFNNIASNTTDTVSYDTSTGIIGLGQNRSYRFTYIPYIRFNNSSGFVELLLTVNGNSTVMSNSVTGYFRPLTSSSHETPSNIIFGQLTTGGSRLNTVRVTMKAPTEVQDFYGGGYGPVNLMFIEEYPL